MFPGSGLLVPAMYFVAMAVAGGLVASASAGAPAYTEDVIHFGGSVMLQTMNTFAPRMAGAFTISLGTMWLRTGLMPPWLAVPTYLSAVVLLAIVSPNLFVFLVFPGCVVSLVHLSRPRRGLVVEPG